MRTPVAPPSVVAHQIKFSDATFVPPCPRLVQTFGSGQPDNRNVTLPFYIILPLPSKSDNQNQSVIPKPVDEQPVNLNLMNLLSELATEKDVPPIMIEILIKQT